MNDVEIILIVVAGWALWLYYRNQVLVCKIRFYEDKLREFHHLMTDKEREKLELVRKRTSPFN